MIIAIVSAVVTIVAVIIVGIVASFALSLASLAFSLSGIPLSFALVALATTFPLSDRGGCRFVDGFGRGTRSRPGGWFGSRRRGRWTGGSRGWAVGGTARRRTERRRWESRGIAADRLGIRSECRYAHVDPRTVDIGSEI